MTFDEVEGPLIEMIHGLHRSGSGTLDTGEKIAAFDFEENVLRFLLEEGRPYNGTAI